MKTKILSISACMALFVLFVGFSFNAFAQNKDTEGKEFWLMFPLNYTTGQSPTLSLFISSKHSTAGTVTIPGLSFTQAFTVTPGVVTTVIVPANAQVVNNFTVENKGIKVVANDDISVYGLNRIQYTTDAYCGIPTDAIGTHYLALAWPQSSGSQVSFVATQNNTTITIIVPVSSGPFTANVPRNIVLNQGQTYVLNNYNDLSGTSIIADKPISVFGGNQCGNIPLGYFACDFIIEQIPALDTWGKRFVTIPLRTRRNGDTYKMMVAENGTTIRLNGTVIATLNKGQTHTRIIDGSSEITSDKPILLAQFSNGSQYDGVTSDPFMIIIPPTEQFLTSYTFATPATGFRSNFVNIAAPDASIGLVKLDGVIIPPASFTPIGSTGFNAAQLNISLGSHTLDGTSQAIGAFVYGFDDYDSYGYPAGSTYTPIAVVNSLTIDRTTGTATICEEICWEATIKNSLNEPVAGVRVDFNISGANPSQSGTALTNANGVAKFCYKGAKEGDDVINIALGNLSQTANFTWTWAECRPDTDGDGVVDEEDCAPNDPDLFNNGVFYVDADGDGYTDGETDVCYGETLPSMYTSTFIGDDCDDSDPNIFREVLVYFDEDNDGYHNIERGQFEICIGAGLPVSPYIEVSLGQDCNDKNAAVYPGATELCDNLDNDCDVSIDEGCTLLPIWYRDVDKDGFGSSNRTVRAATQPKGYVNRGGDCKDADPKVYPGAPELPDGKDNNCNGQTDEGLDCVKTWYRDYDGDGYGQKQHALQSCVPIPRHVLVDGDCNDANKNVYPGAPELPDGLDNNCNGATDEGLDCIKVWYKDRDGDGYGFKNSTRYSCIQPQGFVAIAGDCNDYNSAIYPGAREICDGLDNDCNKLIDDNCTPLLILESKEIKSSKMVEPVISTSGLGIRAWPNPAKGQLSFEVNNLKIGKKAEVMLVNATGRTVKSTNFVPQAVSQVQQINVSGLGDGLFILVVGQEGVKSQTKVMLIK